MHKSLAAAAVAALATAGTVTATVLATSPEGAAAQAQVAPAAQAGKAKAGITQAGITQVGAAQAAAGAQRIEETRPRYRHIALPTQPCRYEDSPGPCFWDAGMRGNGHGASFWRGARGRVHYVSYRRDVNEGWHPAYDRCHYDSSQPEPPACVYPYTYFTGWKRVSSPMSDALAEGEYGTERDWTRCIEHVGETTYIVCPDGFEIVP